MNHNNDFSLLNKPGNICYQKELSVFHSTELALQNASLQVGQMENYNTAV